MRDNYGSYRGRITSSDVLKVIIVILLILVVIVVGLLLFAQRYLVYSDEGVRLELPPFLSFLQPEREQPPAGPDLDNVTFVEKELEPEPGSEPAPEPEPESEPPLAAVQLPLSALTDGTAAQLLENAGANALIVEMKPPQGPLNWFSGTELAEERGINAADRGINRVIRNWNAGEVYTVARVSCLRDNTLPYRRRDLAVHASYGNWQDERRTRWLNPTLPEVQSYLAELCGELAELGFDEILLENCAYPTGAASGAITNLDRSGREQVVQGPAGLLAQIKAAVEPSGTRLSVKLDAPLPAEGSGGLTQDGISRLLSGMWLPKTEDAAGGGSLWTVYTAGALETGLEVNQAVLLPDSPVTTPKK